MTTITHHVIIVIVIKSFADRETEKIFQREFSRKLPPAIQHRARIKLEIIDAAEVLEDLRIPPANRLERLTGNRQGQHSIRINEQWRICFVWRDNAAHEVEIVDYH
ncbi:MAG: type II toxin-antitoxin system RelE/ParE family toxin [Caldilineaceae bacterium]